MPEGDTIFRAARTLHRALAGQVVTGFESVLPKLERVEVDSGVTGRTLEKVESNGKWLLIHFSGNLILLTHMLMSGSWHIYRPGEAWKRRPIHKRIVIATDKFVAVAFNVPVAEFHSAATLERRLGRLGPSILSEEIEEGEILANLRAQAESEVGAALLDQSVLAGIGNVFKSEVCFGCGVNPFRRVASLTIQETACLVATARKFMLANIAGGSSERMATYSGLRRTTGRSGVAERLWVYRRRGEPCRRCGTAVESRKQMPWARTTFWCSRCQPMIVDAVSRSVVGGD